MTSRRTFLLKFVASATPAALLAGRALAESPPFAVEVLESDPTGMALGFKLDTTTVDEKKYPTHTAAQKCADCLLYQPKPGAALAPCTAFSGKLVPAAGWCAAYVKNPKAAN